MESGKKKVLGVVATLVVLQLLMAAPGSMVRSPQALQGMAQSGKVAMESLILETPVRVEMCGETCMAGTCCMTSGCHCEWPVCVRPSMVLP